MRARAEWVLLLLLGTGSVAQADDWRQSMRDEFHTNASRDRVAGPLAPIWSTYRSTRVSGANTQDWTTSCVIDKGRVFYVTFEPELGRMLVALDARTSSVLWRTRLNTLRDNIRTSRAMSKNFAAVTQNGLVVAYDYLYPARNGQAPAVRNGEMSGNPVVRVFRPDVGLPVDGHAVLNGCSVPLSNPVDIVRRVFMFHRPAPLDQQSMLSLSAHYPDPKSVTWGPEMPRRTAFGPPLVSGDEIAAADQFDLFFRWRPLRSAQYFRLTHVHPRNEGLTPEAMPSNLLDGFPIVKLPAGYLIGDNSSYKYLAALTPDSNDERPISWHVDIGSSFGIPSTEGQTVFFGVNGPAADQGIMALDAGNGALRWVYPFGTPRAERTKEGIYTDILRVCSEQLPGSRPIIPPPDPATPNGRPSRRTDPRGILGNPGSVNIPVKSWRVESKYGVSHRVNRGLVLARGRVFGMVSGHLVALEQKSGKEQWRVPLLNTNVESYAGTRTHILVSISGKHNYLRAYRMDNGKLDWDLQTNVAGEISIASGVVFIVGQGAVHAFAPAERTFALGIDSALPADYRPIKLHVERDEADTDEERARRSLDPTKAPEEEEKETLEQEAARKRALGEVSVLRFTWGRPATEMLQQVTQRQQQLPGVPLVVSIDWLNAKRSQLLTPSQGKWWTAQEADAFAVACAQLARAARPQYMDIAPELNVYLARYPELSDQALSFVQRMSEAVKAANSSTKVVASFNAELLLDRYGKTDYVPFGVVARPRAEKLSRLEPILRAVDAVGLTLRPETGFVFADQIPSNYLFPLREWIGKKPLVITALDIRSDPRVREGPDKQMKFLNQVLKGCYWLETKLIAVRLDGLGSEDSEFALRTLKAERPAFGIWRNLNNLRLVNYLSSELALGKVEIMPEPQPVD